ncbi:MAG TPA: family 43 glycosylhydrolase [Polyangia bacterium]
MNTHRTFLGLTLYALVAGACASPETAAEGTGGSAGQSTGSGGNTGTGGGTGGGAGHSSGTGGVNAGGGNTGTGGTSGSGGITGSGGAIATGGHGGTAGTSGAAGSGGATGSGGANSLGGTTGSGGTTGAGGKTGSGGTGATGGGGGSGGSAGGGAVIVNDTFWKDSAGTFIYSQGGGALLVGDTYYWYGVDYGGAATYAADPSKGKNSDESFSGITAYSSTDLANWKLETTSRPANTGGWFGRLGVVYNATTKKYVLVAQGGGGLYFATSDTPSGPFVYNNVQTNLPGIVNGGTGDQTTFQDDDGSAYLVSSSSNGRSNRYVSPLRPSDFLAAQNAIPVYSGGGREGNCMFKHSGTYYFCSSDLHGWNSSQTYCVSATNLKGPWSAEFVLDGTQPDYSHVTQTGFFISVQGTAGSFVIFAGDRWSDFAGNGLGFNQWMPISFTGTTPHFQSLSRWSIDAKAGTWAVAPGNDYVLNPSFEADRVSVTVPVGWKATGGSNVSGGHTGRWSMQVAGNGSLQQQIAAIPDGTYTLSVWAKASGTGAQLYANCGGTDVTTAIASAAAFTKVTSTVIAVSGGQCTIGITAGAAQVTVDDFVLSNG